VRVATVNLLGGRSVTTGEIAEPDLHAAAEMVDADVVALQEVDRDQPRSHGTDQTRVVAEALGAGHCRFLPTINGTPGGAWTPASGDGSGEQAPGPAYGIGLVSRLPVTSWAVRRFKPAPVGLPLLIPGQGLAHVNDEPRAALAAVLETAIGPLTVIATHLSFVPGWNVAQLRALTRWSQSLPGPRVLLGDLNLPGPVARLSSRWVPAGRVATYPSWRPRVQFDHVLLDGLPASTVRTVEALRLPVSDHRALVVDLGTLGRVV
jgi:endonuclease/exonuclease/phosphatase family metal-dependent hydrolase